MIEFAAHLLEFSEYADFDERENFYTALCNIFKRAELNLAQIGF